MAWGMIGGAAVSLIGGSLLGGGGSPGQQGQQAQQMVDPFSPYRAQYSQQLNALMQNPSSVQNLPGYQAQQAQGSQVLQRQLAATGNTQSGAEQIALQQFGQQYQGQAFQQQLQNLSMLSGAQYSPAAGGQAGVQAQQGAQGSQNANIGALASLGGMAYNTYNQPTAQNTQVDPGVQQQAQAGTGLQSSMPNQLFK